MADWTNLPPELLALIAQHFAAHDFIVFGTVCKPWQYASHALIEKPPLPPWLVLAEEQIVGVDDIFFCSVCRTWESASYTPKIEPLVPSWIALAEDEDKGEVDDIFFFFKCSTWQYVASYSKYKKKSPPLPPWFVLVEDRKVVHDAPKIRRFFNLSTLRTYEFELPEASGRNCMGAGYGCIFTLGTDLQINLLQPFTRKQITLPPMPTFSNQYNYHHGFRPQQCCDMFVSKVALSSNPWIEKRSSDDDHNCVVAAIYGERNILAFARPGDEAWTNIHVPSSCYEDIIFYEGKFYAVDCHGGVVVCDIDGNIEGPTATTIAPIPIGTRDDIQKYLIESSGDLLLIFRICKFEGDENDETWNDYTVDFSILKLEECCDHQSKDQRSSSITYPYKWIEVNSLGDSALFLGRNPSLSLPASKYSGSFESKLHLLYR